MANCKQPRVKLTNAQLKKLKCATKIENEKEKLSRWNIAPWVIFNNKTKNINKKCFRQ